MLWQSMELAEREGVDGEEAAKPRIRQRSGVRVLGYALGPFVQPTVEGTDVLDCGLIEDR